MTGCFAVFCFCFLVMYKIISVLWESNFNLRQNWKKEKNPSSYKSGQKGYIYMYN